MKKIKNTIIFYPIPLLLFYIVFFIYAYLLLKKIYFNIDDLHINDIFNIVDTIMIIEDKKNIKMNHDLFYRFESKTRSSIIIFNNKLNFIVNPDKKYNNFSESCQSLKKIGRNKNSTTKKCLDSFIEDAIVNRNNERKKEGDVRKTYVGTEISVDIKTSTDDIKKEIFQVYTVFYSYTDERYVSVIRPETSNNLLVKMHIIQPLFYVFTAFSFVLFLCYYFVVSKIIFPLEVLSKQIERLPGYDFIQGNINDLTRNMPVSVDNEIGQVAKTFFYMIEKLSISIKNLVEKTAVNERIESELNVAREIQLGILPKELEKQIFFEIYAYLIPAREIGGDLYDFFFIDEDHFCFSVGDVAGKGVPAALFMVIAKKLISSNANKTGSATLSPAEIMKQINEILCKDNPSSTFITLFIGILNVKSGELVYANGGHVPPIFVDCGGGEPKYRKDLSGPFVGVMPGIPYKDIATALQPGGAVFLCTDGVTEAMNEEDVLFSDKRLLEDFCRMKDKSCKEAVDGILHEVKTHAGKTPQSDDIAMLMIRWTGSACF